MDSGNMQELRLSATPDTLYTVLDMIEERLDGAGCPPGKKTEILIAVEEMYINIVHYAYGGKTGEAIVQMEVTSRPEVCRIVLRDHGTPYNPLTKDDPDVTLSAEQRKIGGLGIYMAKKSMDLIHYEYRDGSNILTMEKNLA